MSRRKRFESIIHRAGLVRWPKLFQVLRRNCETDWAQVYPQYVVSYWMGHDITVSDAHYLQVPIELYAKVAHTATKTATKKDAVKASDRKSLSDKYPRQDSNLQPSASEADALSS